MILLQNLNLENCLALKELFQVQGRFGGRSFPGPASVAVLQIRTRFLHVPQESGEVQRLLITPRGNYNGLKEVFQASSDIARTSLSFTRCSQWTFDP